MHSGRTALEHLVHGGSVVHERIFHLDTGNRACNVAFTHGTVSHDHHGFKHLGVVVQDKVIYTGAAQFPALVGIAKALYLEDSSLRGDAESVFSVGTGHGCIVGASFKHDHGSGNRISALVTDGARNLKLALRRGIYRDGRGCEHYTYI